jgi:hypothetical protein
MTPIHRQMGGRHLACGCFTGFYAVGQELRETLDACDPDCPDGHRAGLTVKRRDLIAGGATRRPTMRRRPRQARDTAASGPTPESPAPALAEA